MKKMHNFDSMEFTTSTNDLMNYESISSNSNNYGTLPKTPSPSSFPDLMENGVLVKYEAPKFVAEIVKEDKIPSGSR